MAQLLNRFPSVVFGLCFILLAVPTFAISVDRTKVQSTPPPLSAATPSRDRLPDAELNRQIERLLTAPEYGWHKPTHFEPPPSWSKQLEDWVRDSSTSLGHAIRRLFRTLGKWVQNLIPQIQPNLDLSSRNNQTLSRVVQVLAWIMIAIAACVLILVIMKLVKPNPAAIARNLPPATAATPDLDNEATAADELPEHEWFQLAHEKAGQGDLRQALRALFLASLSLLGAEGLVLIRRSKSNFDYERELRGKSGSALDVTNIFSAGRQLFERCWYGAHPATTAEFDESTRLYQRLKHACLRNQEPPSLNISHPSGRHNTLSRAVEKV